MQGAPARGEAELAAVRALGLAADDVRAIEVRAWHPGAAGDGREALDVAWLRQASAPGAVTLAVLRGTASGSPRVVARARFDAGEDTRVSFEQDDPGGPALADLGGAFGVRVSTPFAIGNGSAWCTRLHVWRPRDGGLGERTAIDVAFESVRRAPPRLAPTSPISATAPRWRSIPWCSAKGPRQKGRGSSE